MSYHVHADGGDRGTARLESDAEGGTVLGFDALEHRTAPDRWPQLARGHASNDFVSLRVSVAYEWDDVDHEDLHVDPAELLDLSGGD
ncbi:hypothetical protein [Haloarchaeobius sp. HRN-SO-5]|uniref:hypothetical protein n=1 Tax=Haloarchaeobius sp. HRN-SO-5 TaxID=3446118 RepID=UPI003EBB88C1